MRCKKCGNKLKNNENFCTVCGNFSDEKVSLENDDLGKYGQDIEIIEVDEDDEEGFPEDVIELLKEDKKEKEKEKQEKKSNKSLKLKIDTSEEGFKDIGNVILEDEELEEKEKNKEQNSKEEKTEKTKEEVEEDEDEDEDISLSNYKIQDKPTEQKSISVDEYTEAYIGEDYNWIVEKPVNIYALLLSWMYFVYRKLYITGIIGLVITGLIIRKLPIILLPYIVLVMVLCGLFFNKIYIKIIQRRVSRIKDNNMNLDGEELRELCKKKGGVNVVVALFIFFLFLGIMLFSYIKIQQPTTPSSFWKQNGENQANCKLTAKQVYRIMQDNTIGEDVEGFACEIIKKNGRKYNIYVKYTAENKAEYLVFMNEENSLILEANTQDQEWLETEKENGTLPEEGEEILRTIKELPLTFKSIEQESNYEAEKVEQKTDTKERTHFIFTKNDITK